MDRGYIRITKAGATEAEQRDKLIAAGVESDHLYIDDTRKPVRGGAADLNNRMHIVNDIRPGSRVVVTDLDRIGVSEKDIIEVVSSIMAKGAGVLDLATGDIFENLDAGQIMTGLVEKAAKAESRQKRGRMGKAREVLKSRKIKPGPPPKLEGAAKLAAREDYDDVTKPIRAVAKAHGISPSTLRRLFGERGTPRGRRRKQEA